MARNRKAVAAPTRDEGFKPERVGTGERRWYTATLRVLNDLHLPAAMDRDAEWEAIQAARETIPTGPPKLPPDEQARVVHEKRNDPIPFGYIPQETWDKAVRTWRHERDRIREWNGMVAREAVPSSAPPLIPDEAPVRKRREAAGKRGAA